MIAITEVTTPTTRHTFKTFPTFAEAVDFAKSNFSIVHFEIDANNTDAADFFTTHGIVYAIQPV